MSNSLRARLLAAASASDFPSACKLLADYFASVARFHAKECQKGRVPYDAAFWPSCVARSERAAYIYAAYMEKARQAAAERMRREDLAEFADALVSGDYAGHLDLPDASGGIDGLLSSAHGLSKHTTTSRRSAA